MPRSEFLRSDDLPISSTGASTTIVGAGGGGTVGTDAQTLQGHPAADFLGPSYVTITNDGNLTAERALAVGSGLTMTDSGANGTVTLDLADGVAGAGLTITSKVLAVGAGLGITVNADDVALSSSVAGAGLTYNAGVLNVGAGAGITVNADDVALTTPGMLSSTSINSSAGNHTHAVTAYSDGSVYPGHLLKSDGSGDLKLHKLELSDRLRTSLLDSQAGTSLTIQPALDLLLSPGSGLVKATNGVALQSDGYASQTTGWRITYDGQGDFRYLYSNELHAKAFIADLEQALAGEQIICKSVAVLAADFVLPAAGNSADFYVEDLPGVPDQAVFQSGDMVRFRQYTRSAGSLTIGDAWGTVSNYVDQANGTQKWTFTRSTGSNAGIASGTINAKTQVLDYGTAGNGFYEVNAIDGLWAANSPYAQIATWSTHPAADTITRARFGNLSGLFGSTNEYGLYAGDGTATANRYLRLSNQFLEGHNLPIHLYDGSAQVIKLEPGTNPYMGIGNPAPSGYLSASGIWAGRDSDTLYKMHVGTISGGDIAKGWKWDGSNLIVKGDVYITNGDIAGTPASYVHGWQYGSTTYINGGTIQANTVTADKFNAHGANMLGNPGFETGTFADWTYLTHSWISTTAGDAHSGTCALVGAGDGVNNYSLCYQEFPVTPGLNYYASCWAALATAPSGSGGGFIEWLTAARGTIGFSNFYGGLSTYQQFAIVAQAPSNAAYARVTATVRSDANGTIVLDDFEFYRADGKLLVGTPGSSRVEINNNGIEGYNSSNTKQFYLQTSDGKAYCAGGSVTFDQNRISISVPSSLSYGYLDFVTGSSTIGKLRMSTGGSPVMNVMYLASENYGSGQIASTIVRALQDSSNFNELRVDWNASTSHAYWYFQGAYSGTSTTWAQIDVPFSGTPSMTLFQSMNLAVAGGLSVGTTSIITANAGDIRATGTLSAYRRRGYYSGTCPADSNWYNIVSGLNGHQMYEVWADFAISGVHSIGYWIAGNTYGGTFITGNSSNYAGNGQIQLQWAGGWNSMALQIRFSTNQGSNTISYWYNSLYG